MTSLPQSSLIALAWTFTGSALVLTAGRFIIRSRIMHKLQLDDAFLGLAALVLIGYITIYTISFSFIYPSAQFGAGVSEPPTNAEVNRFIHLVTAISATFWFTIYLVKFSFLVFYRMLFGISSSFMVAWWIVLTFTVITFLASFIALFWSCGAPEALFNVSKCLSLPALIVSLRFVKMWCVLNVISDVAIMALPLWMLRTLQIRIGQKIGLTLLFLIAAIDIVFDVLRTIYNIREELVGTKTLLWDILEPNIAVMVCALPTYHALFRDRSEKSRTYRNIEHAGNKMTKTSGEDGHGLSDTSISISEPENGRMQQFGSHAKFPVTMNQDQMATARLS